MSNPATKGMEKPHYICPSCNTATFDSQRKLIEHALPCKRGELKNEQVSGM